MLRWAAARLRHSVVGLTLAAPSVAIAAPPPPATPATLTLNEAEAWALAHNGDVRVAEAAVRAALAQLRIAREFPNPSIAASVGKINTDGRGNGTVLGNRFLERSYDSIIALNQLIEIGKRHPRQESAQSARRAAEARREDARRLLRRAVAQAYIGAVEAGKEVQVLTDSAESMRREVGVAEARLKAGDISTADDAQIEIAAERFTLDAEAARATQTSAVITLETLLGLEHPQGDTRLSDTLASLAAIAPDPGLSTAPINERPDIAAAEADVAKAEADVRLQRRNRIPDLTATAQFERNPPDAPNSAGLGVSLPLPLWNRNGGQIAAAVAARDQAQAELEQLRLAASAEVAQASSSARVARVRLETFQQQLLPKSEDVVRSVTYAYGKGGASLLDLLSAQRNDNDLRLAAARAQADYATALSALAAALNREFAISHP